MFKYIAAIIVTLFITCNANSQVFVGVGGYRGGVAVGVGGYGGYGGYYNQYPVYYPQTVYYQPMYYPQPVYYPPIQTVVYQQPIQVTVPVQERTQRDPGACNSSQKCGCSCK